MTTPSIDNPKFVEQDDSIGMIIDDTQTIAAHEVYRDHETSDGTKQRVFLHTAVDEEYRGAGLAGKLVQHVLDEALEDGYRIVAVCPYVKSWIEKSDDPRYAEASDVARPEHF